MNVSELCSDFSTEPTKTFDIEDGEPETGASHDEELQIIKEQSVQLHSDLKDLKARHKTINSEEREKIIEDMCLLTEALCRSIDKTYKNSRKMDSLETDDEDDGNSLYNADRNNDYELIRRARNNQGSHKYHRRTKRTMIGHKCHSCGTKDTPEWRRGPDGARTLCNACGLHYSKLLRKGAIGVQTGNYLLKNQAQIIDRDNARSNEEKKTILGNYPFILMDPKYGLNSNKEKSLPQIQKAESQFRFVENHEHRQVNEKKENSNKQIKFYKWKQQ